QKHVVALLERPRRWIRDGGGGFGFGAGWHGPNVAPDAALINLSRNARTDNAKGLLSPLGTASAMRPPATVAGTTSTSTRALHARCHDRHRLCRPRLWGLLRRFRPRRDLCRQGHREDRRVDA